MQAQGMHRARHRTMSGFRVLVPQPGPRRVIGRCAPRGPGTASSPSLAARCPRPRRSSWLAGEQQVFAQDYSAAAIRCPKYLGCIGLLKKSLSSRKLPTFRISSRPLCWFARERRCAPQADCARLALTLSRIILCCMRYNAVEPKSAKKNRPRSKICDVLMYRKLIW